MIVDTSELDQLAAELLTAADRALVQAAAVMDDAGEAIRDQAVQLVEGQIAGRYLPHYPSAITAETSRGTGEVELEVGPEIGALQGGMGPGVEFGSANTGPLPHLLPAGEQAEPGLAEQLAEIGVGVLAR